MTDVARPLSEQQRANLRAKLPQLSAAIRAAEQNLTAAKTAGNTHSITSLARAVQTAKDRKEEVVRQLGDHPSLADERRGRGGFGARRR
jgi:hypothetical protein